MTDSNVPSPKVVPASPYRVDKLADMSHRPSEKVDAPSAKLRLETSRTKLRDALRGIARPAKPQSLGVVDKVTGLVENLPGVKLVRDAAMAWWREHRGDAQTAGQATQNLIAPIVRRHPGGSIGIAAGVGALLVLLRPWRLLFSPKILLGVASLVATQALRSRSLGSWLQLAMKFAATTKNARR